MSKIRPTKKLKTGHPPLDPVSGILPNQVLDRIASIPGTSTLVHFKIEICRSVIPEQIVTSVFEDRKHLVVLHKGKNENPHWHFQGETHMDGKELDKFLATIAETHTKRIAAPKSRPVKRAKKDIDEVGYQYMMKENPPDVVSSCGFTPEELEELHDKSDECVDQIKNQLYYYLIEKLDWTEPKRIASSPHDDYQRTMHSRARELAMEYYIGVDKMPPPNLQKLILWHLVRIAKSKFSDKPIKASIFVLYVGKRI